MANIFKGYVLSNGKVPLSSVKTDDILSQRPTNHDYCGVLYEDIVQIDFDDEESARIALRIVQEQGIKCDVLKTTRGIHLYFKATKRVKSCSTGIYTAIGLKCDVGLGSKNRVVPLRITKDVEQIRIVDGEEHLSITKRIVEREWIQTYPELDDLPAIFTPIDHKDRDIRRSDTRNQTLFNYILVLQYNEFSRDEVRDVIRTINRYVLFTPLPEREIDVIIRDDAFSEEIFFKEKQFLHDRFGNYMLANSNIILINNQPHIYTEDELYSNDPLEFERIMLTKIPSLREAQRREVYKYIALKCSTKGEFSHARYLGLKSRILDVQEMKFYDYTPKMLINNRIPYDYNPKAYHEIMDKTLNKVCMGDIQIRQLLEEMIGYSLYRRNTMQVCFILTGEGSNGKSTILNCIKHLIGKENYTSLDMRELEDTFKPAELYGKLANIGDDISTKYMEGSSIFKKCVTGESFIVARKYGQPFELESYATQIFCANELPQVRDKSDGFNRRIVIIPFNAKFSKTDKDYDPFIEDKLLTDDALEYMLKLAVEGLRRVLINRSFTTSAVGEKEKSDYVKLNNNVLEWLDNDPKIENEAVNDVYLQYKVWCSENGCQPVKKLHLGKEIKKHTSLVSKPQSVDGKTVRIFVNEGSENEGKSG